MKLTILFACICIALSCSSTSPVTANPDRGTTTSGTAGSAKITDGTTNEGMNNSKTTTGIDSLKVKTDSLPR